MKKGLIAALVASISFALLWAMGAFISQEMDPANWETGSRALLVWFWLMSLAFTLPSLLGGGDE